MFRCCNMGWSDEGNAAVSYGRPCQSMPFVILAVLVTPPPNAARAQVENDSICDVITVEKTREWCVGLQLASIINRHPSREPAAGHQGKYKDISKWLPPVVTDMHDCLHRLNLFSMLLGCQLEGAVQMQEQGMNPPLRRWHEWREQVFRISLATMDVGCWMMRMGDGGVNDPWHVKNHAIWLILNQENGYDMAKNLVREHGGVVWP